MLIKRRRDFVLSAKSFFVRGGRGPQKQDINIEVGFVTEGTVEESATVWCFR